MTVQELEAQLKTFQNDFDKTKKEFQLQLDSAKKDADNWKSVAQSKEDEVKKFQAEAEKAQKEKKEAEGKAREQENVAFIEAKIREGKILPAQKDGVIALMKSLTSEGEIIKFSQADGSTKSHSQVSLFKELLNSLSKRMTYGPQTPVGSQPASPMPRGTGEGETTSFREVIYGGKKQALPEEGADLAAKAFEYQNEYEKKWNRKVSYEDALVAVQKQEMTATE